MKIQISKNKKLYFCEDCFLVSNYHICPECRQDITNHKSFKVKEKEKDTYQITFPFIQEKQTGRIVIKNILILNFNNYSLWNLQKRYIINKNNSISLLQELTYKIYPIRNQFFKFQTGNKSYFYMTPFRFLKEHQDKEFRDYFLMMFILFLKNEGLFDFYSENINLFALFNKDTDFAFVRKCKEDKDFFFKKIFSKKINSETIKLLKEIRNMPSAIKELLSLFKNISQDRFKKYMIDNYKKDITSISKEHLEFIDRYNELKRRFEDKDIFYQLGYKIDFREIIKLFIKKDINLANLLLKEIIVKNKDVLRGYSEVKNSKGEIIKISINSYDIDSFIKNIRKLADYNNIISYIICDLMQKPCKDYKDIIVTSIQFPLYLNELLEDLEALIFKVNTLSLDIKEVLEKSFDEVKKEEVFKRKNLYDKAKYIIENALLNLDTSNVLSIDFDKEILDRFDNKNIGEYRFYLLKSKKDFLKTGNEMKNCVAGYFDYILHHKDNKIVVVGEKGNRKDIILELELDNEEIRIIQAFTKANRKLNKKQKEIVKKYLKEIKK